MNVRKFFANWTLQKTVNNNKDQISFHSSCIILKNIYQDDYLDSFQGNKYMIRGNQNSLSYGIQADQIYL